MNWYTKHWLVNWLIDCCCCCSVAQSRLTLWPHGLQHARLPCPSPSPRACSNSFPLNRLCHPAICHPLVLLPSIFPSIRVFSNESSLCIRSPKYGASALASVLPVNIQDWLLLGWTGWISLKSKILSRVFSNTTVQKHQFFYAQLSLGPTLTSIHDYWKNHRFDYTYLCWQSDVSAF